MATAIGFGRAGAEPQLQTFGLAADNAAPQQAVRRRGDDAGNRHAARHDADIDGEFIAASEKLPGAVERIDHDETWLQAGAGRTANAFFGNNRNAGQQPGDAIHNDGFGGLVGCRDRRKVVFEAPLDGGKGTGKNRSRCARDDLGQRIQMPFRLLRSYFQVTRHVAVLSSLPVLGGLDGAVYHAGKPVHPAIRRFLAACTQSGDPSMSGTPIEALDLAALLCSRVCHDLISPIGAIVNGLEVLDEAKDEETKTFALDLIKKSARTASAKLQFCRIAFGAAGSAGAQIDLGDAETISRGFFEDDKTKLAWSLPRVLLPKNRVKLLLNLLLIAGQTIPRGGQLTVDPIGAGEGMGFKVSAAGANAKVPPAVAALLAGDAGDTALDAHRIQPFYASLLPRLRASKPPWPWMARRLL